MRVAAVVIAPILVYLTAFMYEFGTFAQCFKTAKFVPIFKYGNQADKTNHRPISLLSNLFKVLENTIKLRLMTFFEKHNVYFSNRFGFRENHSINKALLREVTKCLDNTNYKLHSCLVMLDVGKAFGTVNHDILFKKLGHYGIRGNANKSY